MDAFVNAHITDALHFRAGQYYLPLGFEIMIFLRLL